MSRCPHCGQYVRGEPRRDWSERAQRVIVWTTLTVFFWGTALSVAVWTMQWWMERWQLVVIGVVLIAGAALQWKRWLIAPRQGRPRG